MTVDDPVKAKVAAHWNRRAANFDTDFGHSIATPAERAAWDRILDLITDGRSGLDALDCGCGTGFLSFELAARGHRVTGIDFAPAMLEAARAKAAENGAQVNFEQGDAENSALSGRELRPRRHPACVVDPAASRRGGGGMGAPLAAGRTGCGDRQPVRPDNAAQPGAERPFQRRIC